MGSLHALVALLLCLPHIPACYTCLLVMQVLLLLRQMECTITQATASKVSLLMLGQQAVIDAYLCLLHLTTGLHPTHRNSCHTTTERLSPCYHHFSKHTACCV